MIESAARVTTTVIRRGSGYDVPVDITSLRCFLAVEEELSFTRAAARVHMATSPLCRRIKNFEADLGGELFVRTNHSVRLTPLGEMVSLHAREIVERFDALQALAGNGTAASDVLRIGLGTGLNGIVRDRVFDILGVGCGATPVTLEVGGGTAVLTERVLRGDLAMALVHEFPSAKSLESWPIMVESLGIALPSDHPLAAREAVPLRELAGLTYITCANHTAPQFFGRVNAHMRAAGIEQRLELPEHDVAQMANLVAGGLGFTLVLLDPSSLSWRACESSRITIRPLADVDIERTTMLVWSTYRARTAVQLERLVRTLISAFPVPFHAGAVSGTV